MFETISTCEVNILLQAYGLAPTWFDGILKSIEQCDSSDL